MDARTLKISYRFAATFILGGFLMLCQPVFESLFSYGFPILLAGVILFMILDHIPEKLPVEED
jgi:hypothetical protein